MYRCDVCGATDPKKHEPWCEKLRKLADRLDETEQRFGFHHHAVIPGLDTTSAPTDPAPDTILPEHAHRVETPDAQQDTYVHPTVDNEGTLVPCPVCKARWRLNYRINHEYYCTPELREDHRKARLWDEICDGASWHDWPGIDHQNIRCGDCGSPLDLGRTEVMNACAIAERAREVEREELANPAIIPTRKTIRYILHGGDDDGRA